MKSDEIFGSPKPLTEPLGSKKATTPACCAPPALHAPALIQSVGNFQQTSKTERARAEAKRATVALPGGTFLMGTDYGGGFPQDGEGPVRPVALSAFEIDAYPVTNEDFAAFVTETRFLTEAEKFGWSFVFWSHIPDERFEELVEDTAAATPWWCKVPGAAWNQPEGPGSGVNSRQNHPVV